MLPLLCLPPICFRGQPRDARHPSYEVLDDGRMLRIRYLYRAGKVAVDTDRDGMPLLTVRRIFVSLRILPISPTPIIRTKPRSNPGTTVQAPLRDDRLIKPYLTIQSRRRIFWSQKH